MVVQPQTTAGVVLSSIGSAAGAWAMTTATLSVTSSAGVSTAGAFITAQLGLGNSWLALNLVAPGIGAFVGFVLGALIGNLFGKKKPKIPSASAETVLQIPYARYELGTVTVTNNGNRDLVTSMATTARDTLNGLIATVAYINTTAYVSNLNGYSTTQAYGHTASQIYVKVNGVQTNFSSADQAVEFGTLAAIRNTKIVGGDIFAKRAIARSPAADLTSLTGDLQIASDYRYFAGNRGVVNGFIIGAYVSLTQAEQDYYAANKVLIDKAQTQGTAALTAGELSIYNANKPTIDSIIGALENQARANPWIITLQRVSELGLDKWTSSDFYGGLQGFLSSFDLAGHGAAFENGNFVWNGADFTVSVAGGTEGVLSLLPSASADGRSATINGLDKIGYTWVNAGGATAGNDYMEYRWNGGGVTLDDQHDEQQTTYDYYWNGYEYEQYETTVTVSVSGGDDIFVGSQYNDALYGRTGWDWLDGQGGDDYIEGGDQNDTLLGGAGRDRLYGGAGDDYLAGGDGDDAQTTWGANNGGLFGGAGDDVLVGNAGADEIWGEDGDDIMIVDYDGGGVYDRYEGGAGSDTISYERFGSAAGVDFRNSSPWGDPWEYIYGDAVSAENITGSAFNDWFCGDDTANVLKGMAGNDELHGWGGDDTIEGGTGADVLNGWGGTDTLSYAGSAAGVYIDLSTGEAFGGDAEGDTFTDFENVTGSRLADQLKGNAVANRLVAGAGDDWLVATAGADRYEGGEGKDFVDYSASTEGVYLILSSYTPTFQYDGTGYTGLANGHTYNNVEGVVGSAYTDYLYGGEGDQTFIGGAGSDFLAGAAGADTYVINRGDGYDTVTEDNTGWNVLSFGENVKFSDLWFGTAGGANGWLDVGVRGDNAQFRVSANFANLNSSKIKTLDLSGAGQLDMDGIEYAPAASDNSEAVNGWSGRRDLIVAYNGDDAITGSGGAWEDKGNVVIGGLGNDTITTSGGDDQFAYDRGDGVDTITDAGGEDTLVFGATVAAEDVIYQVVGNDLYIGAKDAANAALTASQVADRVRVAGGGVKYVVMDGYSNTLMYESLNTVEYVLAGGTSIDLRKLDIAWTQQVSYNYDNYYPIALDLDGDGLNLSAVDSSQVVVKTAQGGISRIGWVGPTDGFLAVDRDGDGAINKLSEISFVQDKPGATSDLEGLRTWDSNGDGVLDKADKDFSKILLFVDANQNGRSTAKELRTLEQAGIKAINLGGTATGQTAALTTDSFVQNTISFVWADGRTGEGYDVALARRVLGSEGLYAGAYQAEWGARDEDGTLGQLLNDPKTAAKAARIHAKRGLLDKLGASYAEVKAAAQLDFSDNDKVDAAIARRWKKMDASQKAAWLSGQASGMDGQSNLAALKAISSGQALSNALAKGAQAGQDLVAQGLAQAGARVLASASDPSGGGGSTAPAGLGVDFGAASGLSSGLGGGLAASQLLDGVAAAGGAIGQDQAWWRGQAEGGLAGAGSLAALLAAMDQGPGDPARGSLSTTDDPALLQQQMLLRQAMAGFGGPAGGSAAVWNRDAVQASAVLAAAGHTTTPSALNLALAS
jgi:Ca2+-binding RTX toxin-like protein